MNNREPLPPGYDELGRGISLIDTLPYRDGDMLAITEQGIACFQEALKDPENLVTDKVRYERIAHNNAHRTPAIVLGLRGRELEDLHIDVPRKDDSLAITITADDLHNPNRHYIFTEITDAAMDDKGAFIVDDTDWHNAERVNRGIEQYYEKHEVAHWLYRQAGMDEDEIARKLKTESDPVQNAAHIVGLQAERVIAQRIVKARVAEGLTFYGEEISVTSPDELTLQPGTPGTGEVKKARPLRLYNFWFDQVLDTDSYGGVSEKVSVSTSPDNIALFVPNPRNSMTLSVETTNPLEARPAAELYQERRDHYMGNVAQVFENISEMIRRNNEANGR